MEVLQQNKKLEEPLKKAKQEVEELTKNLANYEKDKRSLTSTKKRLKMANTENKNLAWKHEVLEQRYEKCKAERDDLYNNYFFVCMKTFPHGYLFKIQNFPPRILCKSNSRSSAKNRF